MVNTINPADCDRVTVYAGECRNFQDTEWITFNSGRRRSPDARDGNTWLIDVAHGSFWMRDDQVRDLVRLVPARPITSDDLPERLQVFTLGAYRTAYFDFQVRDALAGHLNANGGVPQSPDSTYGIPCEDYAYVDWPATCAAEKAAADRAEAERDRWRRAHEIVEGERDQARESLRRLRDETDFDLFTVRDQLKQCRGEREQMTRERDEVRADRDYYADSLGATVTERAEWKARAEALEAEAEEAFEQGATWQKARTAPAVSRADVSEALSRRLDPEMWNVTFLAVVNEICDLFGIEAEQAVDPTLDKAQEFAALADWELTDREAGLLHTVARHVLGQEASDE